MRTKIIKLKTTVFVFVYDMLMIPIAWFLSYWLRFNTIDLSQSTIVFALQVFPFLAGIQVFFFWYFGLYRGVWRFASLPDLIRIIKAVVIACAVMIGVLFLGTRLQYIPRTVFPIYCVLLIVFLGGSRMLYRYFKEHVQLSHKNTRVLIIGAGSAGELLVRDLLRASNHDYFPIGFVDDALDKQGKEIHGIRVLGVSKDIKKIVERENVDLALIALPSANSQQMRKVVEACRDAKVKFQTLPSIGELASSDVTLNSLREVDVEDLLGREPVAIDWHEVQGAIQAKVILISGGGGSIGSEICRQVARLKPKTLVVLERAEFNLYQLQQEITELFPDLSFVTYLGSVADKLLVQQILEATRPEIIFHAAAYKHVPILESQAYAACANNVVGTKVLAEAAIAAGVKKFVMVSTDKAVRPTNVMGATKRLAEMICQTYVGHDTKFITVRFGNVLGSSGSVVPLFKKQLLAGGPITVTHPEITRYFMTIPEAVCLILQTCVLAHGGEVFVLDMGQPVKILYLAEQIIRLSGKEPGIDVKIVYTGLRPGEKLHEELFYKDEKIVRTKHLKVFQAQSNGLSVGFSNNLEALEAAVARADNHAAFKFLQQLVPEFKTSN